METLESGREYVRPSRGRKLRELRIEKTGEHNSGIRVIDVDCIARVAHDANRAYCIANGDDSQVHWELAEEWQKESARMGVNGILSGEIATPTDSHLAWFRHKEKEGWTYGPVKDPANKQHPCMVPYDMLPDAQKVKDNLFFAIVTALTEPR